MRMTIHIQDGYFVKQVLPIIVKQIVVDRYSSISKTKQLSKMNEHISKEYGITIEQIVSSFNKILSINKYNDIYIVEINRRMKVGGNSLSTIINCIDYGTMTTRGLNLFNYAFRYVQSNIKMIYRFYERGGLTIGN